MSGEIIYLRNLRLRRLPEDPIIPAPSLDVARTLAPTRRSKGSTFYVFRCPE